MKKEELDAMIASATTGLPPERRAELSAKLYGTGLAVAADLYRRNRIAEAAEAYAQLMLIAPGRMEGFVGLGHCLLELEDPFRALATAGDIITADPENASGWFISGKAQYMLGSYESARDDFVTAEECAREAAQSDLVAEITRFRAVTETKLATAGAENA